LPQPVRSTANTVLASLPGLALAVIEPHLTLVSLAKGALLQEDGDEVSRIYFPMDGVASLQSILNGGRTVDTAMLGRDDRTLADLIVPAESRWEGHSADQRGQSCPLALGRELRRPYFGGWSSLESHRSVSDFRGSGRSQSRHWSVRCPLPLGGSARTKCAPQWGQVGRSACPMTAIWGR
jgi:hypothetical protein